MAIPNPDVIITGELVNLFGVATDTSMPPNFGSIEVALCGYGSFTPEVTGAKIALGTQGIAALPASDPNAGKFEILLFSNTIITPPQTYYTITIKNENGDIIQVEAYTLTPGQYDITELIPIDPDQPPPVIPTPPPTPEILDVAWSGTPVFDGTDYTAFSFTLQGDATATIQNMVPGNLYTFIIRQDGNGNHILTWPAGCHGATSSNLQANGTTTQTFVAFDANNLFAIAPGTYL